MRLLPNLFRWPSKLRKRARRSRQMLMFLLLLLFSLLAVLLYVIYKPPGLLISYFQHRWPDVLWQVPVSRKIVALTIDDAPSQYTEEILAVLKANEATATFFAIGSQIDGRESVLRDLISSGSEIGNHAMHDEASRALSDDELTFQIRTVHAKVSAIYKDVGLDEHDLYFRPGSGFFSESMRTTVANEGYRMVLGSVYPHDPQMPFWRANAAHILSMVRPGAIIICHDRRSWTVPMLKKVLPTLKKRGYEIVSVTELLEHAIPR